MASQIFMVASAGLLGVLGVVHLFYTFSGSGLLPRDPALHTTLRHAPLSITAETTVLRAWTGFNASHSLGLIIFGLIYGFLALYHPALLFGSPFLLAVGLATLVAFWILCKRYWFRIPLLGISVALGCYIASMVAAQV